MKVYSPSATMDFQRCPTLWWWRRHGWQSKQLRNPDMAAAVGRGISKGMEVYFRQGDATAIDLAVSAGVEDALAEITKRIEQGAYISPACEKTYELIPKRVEKALRRFHKEPPFPEDWHTYRSELTFPDHGHCRVDLLHQSDLGPCITDFKTKVTAQEYVIDQFLFDAETSWQMYHYVWAAREMGIDVESFAICLIVIEPFHCHVEQYVVDDVLLSRWLDNAEYWWEAMYAAEKGDVHIAKVADHRDKFGLCSMYDLCFKYADNVAAMADYTRREREHDIS